MSELQVGDQVKTGIGRSVVFIGSGKIYYSLIIIKWWIQDGTGAKLQMWGGTTTKLGGDIPGVHPYIHRWLRNKS